jgi:hypothetical protein
LHDLSLFLKDMNRMIVKGGQKPKILLRKGALLK